MIAGVTTGSTPLDVVLTLLSLTGVGSIVGSAYKRWTKKRDKELVSHITNEAKMIDADVTALNLLADRVKTLESQYKDLNDRLSKEMADNSRCQAEAEALRKDNDRQQGEIERLRTRVHDLAEKIQIKDAQILSFQSSLDDLKRRFEVLTAERQHDLEELNRLKKAQ